MSIKENHYDDDEYEDERPSPKKPFLLMHAKLNKPVEHSVKVQPNITHQVEQQLVVEKQSLVKHPVVEEQQIEVDQLADHVVILDDVAADEIAPASEQLVEKPAIIISKVDVGASRHTTRYEISSSQLEALEKGEELSDSVSV